MKVGFTGTRKGMTASQRGVVGDILRALNAGSTGQENAWGEFHEGECVGADDEATRVAYSVGYRIAAHPPSDGKLRVPFGDRPWHADCGWWAEEPYHVRNRDIVQCSEVVIVAPEHPEEDPRSTRSGTWQTKRMALSDPWKVHVVVMGDGTFRWHVGSDALIKLSGWTITQRFFESIHGDHAWKTPPHKIAYALRAHELGWV